MLALMVFMGAARTVAQSEPLPTWTVGHPDLSIGVVEGDEPYMLAAVHDVLDLSDGRIVVVLFMRNFFEMRYFDSSGRHLKTVGRYGDGPFEVGISGLCCVLHLPGDSVLVLRRDGRLAVFDSAGKGVRTARLPLLGYPIAASLVAGDTIAMMDYGGAVQRNGFTDEKIHYLTALGAARLDTVGVGLMRQSVSGGFRPIPLPFFIGARIAASHGRIWFGNGSDGKIYRATPGTTPQVVLTSSGHLRVPVTDEMRARYREAYFGKMGAEHRRQANETIHREHFPEELPGFQDLSADGYGNLWVMAYEPRWSEEPYRFRIFDAQGEPIARAVIPFNMLSRCLRTSWDGWCPTKSYDIGTDQIVAKVEDELGVERVIRYPLRKSGGS
jgi:hypothetical protein